jgi:hypothetical protein
MVREVARNVNQTNADEICGRHTLPVETVPT